MGISVHMCNKVKAQNVSIAYTVKTNGDFQMAWKERGSYTGW